MQTRDNKNNIDKNNSFPIHVFALKVSKKLSFLLLKSDIYKDKRKEINGFAASAKSVSITVIQKMDCI